MRQRISGIYRITNRITGQIYVGQTRDYRKRKKQHLVRLRRGEHPNGSLQRSFRKHGEAAFTFKLLERCDWDSLMAREIAWTEQLRPFFSASFRRDGTRRMVNRSTWLKNRAISRSRAAEMRAVAV